MAEENGRVLCQVCGNTARLVVVVRNPRVNGQYARNVCSRLCGEIKSREGIEEMHNTGGLRGHCVTEMKPILTGSVRGVVVK